MSRHYLIYEKYNGYFTPINFKTIYIDSFIGDAFLIAYSYFYIKLIHVIQNSNINQH